MSRIALYCCSPFYVRSFFCTFFFANAVLLPHSLVLPSRFAYAPHPARVSTRTPAEVLTPAEDTQTPQITPETEKREHTSTPAPINQPAVSHATSPCPPTTLSHAARATWIPWSGFYVMLCGAFMWRFYVMLCFEGYIRRKLKLVE